MKWENFESCPWFIDKLNIEQVHPEFINIGQVMYYEFDQLTGETTIERPKKFKESVQASYSTSIRITVDGQRVRVEGNPSRFGRPENVFGLTSIEDCVQVYNQILARLGIPPFATGRFEFLMGTEDKKQRKTYTGAIIKHIDITKNHAVGYQNEYAFLRGVATLSLPNGKKPFLYPNGATLEWSGSKCGRGSSWDYTKIYIKSVDLIDKEKSNLTGASEEISEYYRHIKECCQANGVVREEHSWKNKKLSRYDLCYYGYVTLEQLVNHHTMVTLETLCKTLEVSVVDYQTIADQLIKREVVKSRQAANATECYAMKWLHGGQNFNLDTLKKTSQFFVHKARLLKLGIDISVPFDPSKTIVPMVRKQSVISIGDFSAPHWYRHATVKQPFTLINGGKSAA